MMVRNRYFTADDLKSELTMNANIIIFKKSTLFNGFVLQL